MFGQDFTCPALLEDPADRYPYGALTRPGAVFQAASARITSSHDAGPTTPPGRARWFRLVPVRSPLLGESRLISVPPGTEMFQFPGLAPHAYA